MTMEMAGMEAFGCLTGFGERQCRAHFHVRHRESEFTVKFFVILSDTTAKLLFRMEQTLHFLRSYQILA